MLSDDDNDERRKQSFNRYAEAAGVEISTVTVDVSVFEGYTMLLAALGSLACGFAYASIFVQILVTVAFSELVKLQLQKDKEEKILIKSKIFEWYLFFTLCFMFLPYWLTLQMLQDSGIAPEPDSLLAMVCYRYHSLVVCCLLTAGMCMFVISLQDGFYAYQFKMFGWTLLSALLISLGSAGMQLALWHGRMWFFFAVVCITVHNAVDFVFCHFFPFKTPMVMLKPEATLEGFVAGVLACFAFFSLTATVLLDQAWLMQVPTKITLVPFDNDATTLASGPLFEQSMQAITWVTAFGLEPVVFIASEFEVHLFVITLFIAFVAPFGGFLYSGLKRALRQSKLGIAVYKSGVVDRLDCLVITGCFLFAYLTLVYSHHNGQDPTSAALERVAALPEAAQRELYERLKADLIQSAL